MCPLNRCNFVESSADVSDRQCWFRLSAPRPHYDFDCFAEIDRFRENVFALIDGVGKFSRDPPDRAPTYIQFYGLALAERAADEEARRNFGFANVKASEELAY